MDNILKKKLKKGETVFGTWTMLPSSFVVDTIARTGVDFVIIDMEHGAMSYQTAEEMIRGAEANNIQPIIRVGDSQENTILHALETGCNAVMVPHVSTVEAAQNVANYTHYAPQGTRGLSPYTRNHDYTHVGIQESLKRSNEEVLTGILVEGATGIANLPEIVKVEGIDLIYLGVYDIAQSVGVDGDIEHPKVTEHLTQCVKMINEAGKISGTFVRDIPKARSLREAGVQFVAFGADSMALTSFYGDAVKEFQA